MVDRGDQAPAFSLESTARTTVRLSDTLDRGPTVVIFFRGTWCSYCAEQLETFSSLAYDMWRHQGIDLLPITSDSISELVEMRDRFDLRIQLLTDPSLDVASTYTGIEDNEKHGRIPIPGTFVVDTDGVVRFARSGSTPADRVYGNYVRHYIKADYADPYSPDYYG